MISQQQQSYISFGGEDMYFCGIRALGVVLVRFVKDDLRIYHSLNMASFRVTPPQDLLFPYLYCTIGSQQVGTLCYRCAVQRSTGKILKQCRHGPKSRSWISTYSTVDIAHPAKLNYQFEYFEIALFEEAERLLERFVTLLVFEKLRHCEYPQKDMSDEEKEEYLGSLNAAMRFGDILGGKELTIQNVQPNAQLKLMAKKALNSFLGFFR